MVEQVYYISARRERSEVTQFYLDKLSSLIRHALSGLHKYKDNSARH